MRFRPTLFSILTVGWLAYPAAQAETSELEAEQARGKALFHESCVYCHGPRGFATRSLEERLGEERALLEGRNDLAGEYIRFVVRRGINSMPWYRRTELSDAELDSVVAYLRRHQEADAKESSR